LVEKIDKKRINKDAKKDKIKETKIKKLFRFIYFRKFLLLISTLLKTILPFLIVIFLFWLIYESPVGDLSDETINEKDSSVLIEYTSSEEVLRKTTSKLSIKEYTPISFEDYYNLGYSTEEEEIIYSGDYFYSTQCTDKNVYINFDKSKKLQYSFNYKEKSFDYEVELLDDLYKFSSELKKQDCYIDYFFDDKMYFEDPYNNYFMKKVSEDFINLKERGYSNDEIVEIATIFVQSIPYGNVGADMYNQYPYETFYKNEGNCLDKSVILAAILKNIGYTTYIVTTQEEEGYHALVAIVCENGNIKYKDEDVCFIETTIHEPVGTDIDIEKIKEYYKVSNGELVYSEESYGNDWSEYIDELRLEAERKGTQFDSIEKDLKELKRKMCDTDCEICYLDDGEYVVNSYSDTCYDAHQYNRYIEIYNQKYQKYQFLYEELYRDFYEIEEAIFWNDYK
jgi:hypothetical protein